MAEEKSSMTTVRAAARRNGATASRKKTQSGQEIVELFFAFVLFMPIFLGAFVVGMNLIRSIQTNQVCRDLDDMYIHGGDFSTYPLQQEAQRLSQGLNLQIGASFAGNEQSNTGNAGNGLVTVSQIMWIGNNMSTSCVSVLPAACTNESSFVFTQQIQFGNGTLANSTTVSVGECPAAILNSSGVVQSYITDSRAALSGSAQTAMQSLWQSDPNSLPLTDQQVAYVVETYFQSPDLSVGGLAGNGVYARYFF
jgi:hypothetical protein